MNQRQISEDKKIIPTFIKKVAMENSVEAEKGRADRKEKTRVD